MIRRGAIAISAILATLLPQVALALPLQAGLYGTRDRIFQVVVQGDRLCYQGLSGNRFITASVKRDRRNDGFYIIHETNERLYQQDLTTLLAGPLHELQVYTLTTEFENTIDSTMESCLESNRDFYEEVETVG